MKQMFVRVVGSLLIFLLSGTTEMLVAQQQAPSTQPAQGTVQPPVELPENPGRSTEPPANNSAGVPAGSATAPAAPAQAQPSGTAVAPAVRVDGGAASKPAGVAIAPPRQRQVRSWLIRFGFIAGAGAAIGTVAALSAGSPGRVPNSPH